MKSSGDDDDVRLGDALANLTTTASTTDMAVTESFVGRSPSSPLSNPPSMGDIINGGSNDDIAHH